MGSNQTSNRISPGTPGARYVDGQLVDDNTPFHRMNRTAQSSVLGFNVAPLEGGGVSPLTGAQDAEYRRRVLDSQIQFGAGDVRQARRQQQYQPLTADTADIATRQQFGRRRGGSSRTALYDPAAPLPGTGGTR